MSIFKFNNHVRAPQRDAKYYAMKARLEEHYDEARQYFAHDNIVGLFCQGSQNYGLDIPGSDLDTKLIVTPTFQDLAFNKKPISTTHVRANNEHIDFKDIRLYIETFRKQNLNFLEILFTHYYIWNSQYADQWDRLINAREDIAHMNPYRAVKSMEGIAKEKYHAFEHPYPSKVDVLAKHGYDPKQLHHLCRVEDYLRRYIKGESYEKCLQPKDPQFLIDIKLGKFSYEKAVQMKDKSMANIEEMAKKFYDKNAPGENEKTLELLRDVQYNIMRISVKEELHPYVLPNL